MNILSITLGHTASVAYFEDWQIKYLLHEEKFDNVKWSANFPIQSIQYIKNREDFSKLDKIVFWSLIIHKSFFRRDLVRNESSTSEITVTLYDYILYYLTKYATPLMNWVRERDITYNTEKNFDELLANLTEAVGFEVKRDMVELGEHHTCHSLSPIYFYWLTTHSEPTLIFTLDGNGDRYFATVRVWKDGKLETLSTSRYWWSIGYLWSNVTRALGMKPIEHEYKVMWLAAYTSEKYFTDVYESIFKDLFTIDGLEWKSKHPMNRAYIFLRKKWFGKRFDNIAGALQYMTEEKVTEWIRNGIAQTGITQIACSGGVFMNVKLNQKIQEMPEVEKAYFMPSCGDESNTIGSAMITYLKHDFPLQKLAPINSMYLGISHTDSEVTEFFWKIKERYSLKDCENDETSARVVAELLEKKEIVAVMRGQGEWGARSLCNRAILANASDLRSFHMVNDMIKMRDFWMPFAPTILESWAPKYLKDWDILGKKVYESAHYMINTFWSTDIAVEHLRAAMHQKDKTLRPQLVSEKTNPWMTGMLSEYEKLTWMGWVMNTSLNIHGYPLVGTLEQALFTFENSGLKYMLINNFLISKEW